MRTREVDLREFGAQYDRATRECFPVKSRDLFVGTVLPFDVLFPSLGGDRDDVSMKVLFPEGRSYDQSLLDWLLKEGIEEVYLRKDKENVYFEYLSQNVKKMLHSPDLPSERKTMLLYDSAESIVGKVFRERPSKENISLGHDLIESLTTHLTTDEVATDALLSIFSKDYYTFTHSVQVAVLGMAFCNYLGWSKEQIADFGIGALFHDVGKSHVEDEILNKPGRLTNDEFETMKKHASIGYQQLKNTQVMSRRQLSVPLSHHESMDGTGYPQALKGEAIHPFARVARIVDCFDALTSRRSYKEAMTHARALDIMVSEMGATFDRRLLDAFAAFLKTGREMKEEDQGKRINLELGDEVRLKVEGLDYELKLSVMGMLPGELLAFHIPGKLDLAEFLKEGAGAGVRYVKAGAVYSFAAAVLGYVSRPTPFVLVTYPKRIESRDMRKDARKERLTSAKVRIRGCDYQGVVLNTSEGGCKVVLKLSEDSPPPEIAVGDRIEMELRKRDDGPQEPAAGVVRNLSMARGKALLGIQFLQTTGREGLH